MIGTAHAACAVCKNGCSVGCCHQKLVSIDADVHEAVQRNGSEELHP